MLVTSWIQNYSWTHHGEVRNVTVKHLKNKQKNYHQIVKLMECNQKWCMCMKFEIPEFIL